MNQLKLSLKSKTLTGKIEISGSKSINNRVLIMDALSGNNAVFSNASNSDDTRLMTKNLKEIDTCASSRIPLVIDSKNAGTVFRFLTAYLSQKKGQWLLTGKDRMKERPVEPLVAALTKLGANISYANEQGYPPLIISGDHFNGGGVSLDASQSSQFVTALMMIGPYLKGGLTIHFDSKPVSEPYIQMTLDLMKQFQADVEWSGNSIVVKEGEYIIGNYTVEPDWSSASYWYQMAALSDDANLFLPGFKKDSVQGDSICAELFEAFGVKTIFEPEGIRLKSHPANSTYFEHDFSGTPDLVPAFSVTCAAKGIAAKFTGIEHLKFKESDRILSLQTELEKVGAKLEKTTDGLVLTPGKIQKKKKDLIFETYDDHRIAMCHAPLFMKYDSVVIKDPETVEKSYPSFWNDIQQAGLADLENF